MLLVTALLVLVPILGWLLLRSALQHLSRRLGAPLRLGRVGWLSLHGVVVENMPLRLAGKKKISASVNVKIGTVRLYIDPFGWLWGTRATSLFEFRLLHPSVHIRLAPRSSTGSTSSSSDGGPPTCPPVDPVHPSDSASVVDRPPLTRWQGLWDEAKGAVLDSAVAFFIANSKLSCADLHSTASWTQEMMVDISLGTVDISPEGRSWMATENIGMTKISYFVKCRDLVVRIGKSQTLWKFLTVPKGKSEVVVIHNSLLSRSNAYAVKSCQIRGGKMDLYSPLEEILAMCPTLSAIGSSLEPEHKDIDEDDSEDLVSAGGVGNDLASIRSRDFPTVFFKCNIALDLFVVHVCPTLSDQMQCSELKELTDLSTLQSGERELVLVLHGTNGQIKQHSVEAVDEFLELDELFSGGSILSWKGFLRVEDWHVGIPGLPELVSGLRADVEFLPRGGVGVIDRMHFEFQNHSAMLFLAASTVDKLSEWQFETAPFRDFVMQSPPRSHQNNLSSVDATLNSALSHPSRQGVRLTFNAKFTTLNIVHEGQSALPSGGPAEGEDTSPHCDEEEIEELEFDVGESEAHEDDGPVCSGSSLGQDAHQRCRAEIFLHDVSLSQFSTSRVAFSVKKAVLEIQSLALEGRGAEKTYAKHPRRGPVFQKVALCLWELHGRFEQSMRVGLRAASTFSLEVSDCFVRVDPLILSTLVMVHIQIVRRLEHMASRLHSLGLASEQDLHMAALPGSFVHSVAGSRTRLSSKALICDIKLGNSLVFLACPAGNRFGVQFSSLSFSKQPEGVVLSLQQPYCGLVFRARRAGIFSASDASLHLKRRRSLSMAKPKIKWTVWKQKALHAMFTSLVEMFTEQLTPLQQAASSLLSQHRLQDGSAPGEDISSSDVEATSVLAPATSGVLRGDNLRQVPQRAAVRRSEIPSSLGVEDVGLDQEVALDLEEEEGGLETVGDMASWGVVTESPHSDATGGTSLSPHRGATGSSAMGPTDSHPLSDRSLRPGIQVQTAPGGLNHPAPTHNPPLELYVTEGDVSFSCTRRAVLLLRFEELSSSCLSRHVNLHNLRIQVQEGDSLVEDVKATVEDVRIAYLRPPFQNAGKHNSVANSRRGSCDDCAPSPDDVGAPYSSASAPPCSHPSESFAFLHSMCGPAMENPSEFSEESLHFGEDVSLGILVSGRKLRAECPFNTEAGIAFDDLDLMDSVMTHLDGLSDEWPEAGPFVNLFRDMTDLPKDPTFSIRLNCEDVEVVIPDSPLDRALAVQLALWPLEYDHQMERSEMLESEMESKSIPEYRRMFFREQLELENSSQYTRKLRQAHLHSPPRLRLAISSAQGNFSPMGRRYQQKANLVYQLDSASKMPQSRPYLDADGQPDAHAFKSLKGMDMNVTLRGFICHLKDHPLPLLSAQSLNVTGKMVLGKTRVPMSSCITRPVHIPIPKADFCQAESFLSMEDIHEVEDPRAQEFWEFDVLTALSPAKVYLDLTSDLEEPFAVLSTLHGALYASVFDPINSLTPPALEPSPPLEWWDELRLRMHGNWKISCRGAEVRFLVGDNVFQVEDALILKTELLLLEYQLRGTQPRNPLLPVERLSDGCMVLGVSMQHLQLGRSSSPLLNNRVFAELTSVTTQVVLHFNTCSFEDAFGLPVPDQEIIHFRGGPPLVASNVGVDFRNHHVPPLDIPVPLRHEFPLLRQYRVIMLRSMYDPPSTVSVGFPVVRMDRFSDFRLFDLELDISLEIDPLDDLSCSESHSCLCADPSTLSALAKAWEDISHPPATMSSPSSSPGTLWTTPPPVVDTFIRQISISSRARELELLLVVKAEEGQELFHSHLSSVHSTVVFQEDCTDDTAALMESGDFGDLLSDSGLSAPHCRSLQLGSAKVSLGSTELTLHFTEPSVAECQFLGDQLPRLEDLLTPTGQPILHVQQCDLSIVSSKSNQYSRVLRSSHPLVEIVAYNPRILWDERTHNVTWNLIDMYDQFRVLQRFFGKEHEMEEEGGSFEEDRSEKFVDAYQRLEARAASGNESLQDPPSDGMDQNLSLPHSLSILRMSLMEGNSPGTPSDIGGCTPTQLQLCTTSLFSKKKSKREEMDEDPLKVHEFSLQLIRPQLFVRNDREAGCLLLSAEYVITDSYVHPMISYPLDLHLRVEGISLHAAAHAVRLEYVWGFPSGQTSSVSAMGTAEDRAKSPSSLLSEGSDALHSGFGHPLFTSLGNPTGVQVRVLRWLEGTRDWKRRVQVSVDELELQMPSLEMNAAIDILSSIAFGPVERRVALEDQVDTLFFSRVLGQPNQQLAKISAAILSLESSIRLLKRDLKDARYYRGGTASISHLEDMVANRKEKLDRLRMNLRACLSSMNKSSSEIESIYTKYSVVVNQARCVMLQSQATASAIASILLCDVSVKGELYPSGGNEIEVKVQELEVDNVLHNAYYVEAVRAQRTGRSGMPQKHGMIRVYARQRAPVNRIPVFEHFEVDVFPMRIQLTMELYQKAWSYFFPDKKETADAHKEHLRSRGNAGLLHHGFGFDPRLRVHWGALVEPEHTVTATPASKKSRKNKKRAGASSSTATPGAAVLYSTSGGPSPKGPLWGSDFGRPALPPSRAARYSNSFDGHFSLDVRVSSPDARSLGGNTIAISSPAGRPPAVHAAAVGASSVFLSPVASDVLIPEICSRVSSPGMTVRRKQTPESRQPFDGISSTYQSPLSTRSRLQEAQEDRPSGAPLPPLSQALLGRLASHDKTGSASKHLSKQSNRALKRMLKGQKPLDLLKDRAKTNKSFEYIKFQDTTLELSFKGLKERDFKDFEGLNLKLSPHVYHNKSWSMQEVGEQLKKDIVANLKPQVLKKLAKDKFLKLFGRKSTNKSHQEPATFVEKMKQERISIRTAPGASESEAKTTFLTGESNVEQEKLREQIMGKLLSESGVPSSSGGSRGPGGALVGESPATPLLQGEQEEEGAELGEHVVAGRQDEQGVGGDARLLGTGLVDEEMSVLTEERMQRLRDMALREREAVLGPGERSGRNFRPGE